jgi:hypothetical protein
MTMQTFEDDSYLGLQSRLLRMEYADGRIGDDQLKSEMKKIRAFKEMQNSTSLSTQDTMDLWKVINKSGITVESPKQLSDLVKSDAFSFLKKMYGVEAAKPVDYKRVIEDNTKFNEVAHRERVMQKAYVPTYLSGTEIGLQAMLSYREQTIIGENYFLTDKLQQLSIMLLKGGLSPSTITTAKGFDTALADVEREQHNKKLFFDYSVKNVDSSLKNLDSTQYILDGPEHIFYSDTPKYKDLHSIEKKRHFKESDYKIIPYIEPTGLRN